MTNLTDKTVFLTTNEFFAAFSGIEYDVCGGWQWDSLVLAPGASADARFHGTLWSHFEPGEGEFTLDMKAVSYTHLPEFDRIMRRYFS